MRFAVLVFHMMVPTCMIVVLDKENNHSMSVNAYLERDSRHENLMEYIWHVGWQRGMKK
jgi:hypothetical protein